MQSQMRAPGLSLMAAIVGSRYPASSCLRRQTTFWVQFLALGLIERSNALQFRRDGAIFSQTNSMPLVTKSLAWAGKESQPKHSIWVVALGAKACMRISDTAAEFGFDSATAATPWIVPIASSLVDPRIRVLAYTSIAKRVVPCASDCLPAASVIARLHRIRAPQHLTATRWLWPSVRDRHHRRPRQCQLELDP